MEASFTSFRHFRGVEFQAELAGSAWGFDPQKGGEVELRILVGTRKGLFTLGRRRGPWEIEGVAFLGDNVSAAMSDPRDGAIYAALDHGHFGAKLHRSEDHGITWQEIGVPVYPEPTPEDLEPPPVPGAKVIPWKLERIWVLEAGGPEEPGRLWCGTLPGGLFRSDDRGSSWSLVESLWRHPRRKEWFGGGADLPGIHSICVDPRDPQRIAVGVSCGGVWATSDGGETWACHGRGMRAEYMPPELSYEPNVQDPHRLVQCRDRPEGMWVQHHNGIFRSADGGASWQEIQDVPLSSFGFAVAVHPENPEIAWFVPGIKDEKRIPVGGKVAVTRTRDGGKSFDVLTTGLPQHHAYDLVYRHALDVDGRGETLVFGSTTGSVWVSEDQGDSWTVVSEHLPPIYCVRFSNGAA
jgi:hypothetical protein